MPRRPRRSTLFPYTTLFRSVGHRRAGGRRIGVRIPGVRSLIRRGEFRSEEHTSELQSHVNLVCRLLLEKKKGIPSVNLGHDFLLVSGPYSRVSMLTSPRSLA